MSQGGSKSCSALSLSHDDTTTYGEQEPALPVDLHFPTEFSQMQPQSTCSARSDYSREPTLPTPSIDGWHSDTTTHDTPAPLSAELREDSSHATNDHGIEPPDNHSGSGSAPSLEVLGSGISTYDRYTPIDTTIEVGHPGGEFVMPHCSSAEGVITSKSILEYWDEKRQQRIDEYLRFKE